MTLTEYIKQINTLYVSGKASEHSYRPALKTYIEQLLGTEYQVINEPKRIDCGAPDYTICRAGLSLAFIEAKDLGDQDLLGRDASRNKEQFDRYKQALGVVLFTDYLDFHLFIDGERHTSLAIGELTSRGIKALPESEEPFRAMLSTMVQQGVQRISSIPELCRLMASKAYLLMHSVREALRSTEEGHLHSLLAGFRAMLMHDLTEEDFADTYAQTIVYGLFAARYNDPSLASFTRQEAVGLIPQSNPFLRSFFADISGVGLDERIAWIVEDLVQIFAKTDLKLLFREWGERTGMSDPLMHFYEDFLSAYNPKLRKDKGVWYTPAPVVRFMVRAVDELLQRDFALQGLQDNSKIILPLKRGTKTSTKTKRGKRESVDVDICEPVELHRLQFLDPATGTGTFPAEILRQIYAKYQGNEGLWYGDVASEILPRLNAFEYLMAPYAIAHLKLSMLLADTGYLPAEQSERLRIYLTNSLEEHNSPDNIEQMFGLQRQVAEEARQADNIKEQLPIMVLIGNPPYNVSSSNKSEWIERLREDYKPQGERNIQPLSDDYVKFIRLGQHYIERNGEGILCFITNNTFLDGIIFREMRRRLLSAFDDIYIIDLHGNAKKQEQTPEGAKDENVFDIQQGVSISIFVRRGGERLEGKMARLWHYDLYGRRADKYAFLEENSFASVPYQALNPTEPYYFFVPKDFSLQAEYEQGFKIDELFEECRSGIETGKDELFVSDDKEELSRRFLELFDDVSLLKHRYNIKPTASFRIMQNVKGVSYQEECISPVAYRPFDTQYCYYNASLLRRGFPDFTKHMLGGDNLGLVVARQTILEDWRCCFCTSTLIDRNLIASANSHGAGNLFPLYLYSEELGAGGEVERVRRPNLRAEIVASLAERIGADIQPEELFDYIYSVLHRRAYRSRYREFLKIDFPRIPYPTSPEQYHSEAERGHRLRQLHLMQDLPSDLSLPHKFPVPGDLELSKPHYVASDEGEADGRIYINKTQYFSGVALEVWTFYIGGYQPAQKWLKDRAKKGYLTHEEVQHYRRILYILSETHALMQDENLGDIV